MLATPPRSRSRAPSKLPGVRPASVRSPWSCHRLENPTAKALFARPGAQPSARHPRTAGGGSFIRGPRGASRPPTRMHAVGLGTGKSGGGPSALAIPIRSRSKAPSKPHGVRPGQGPMVASPPRKSHSESFVGQTRGLALGTAHARRPWGFLYHGTSRRQSPTSAHARCRAGNGEEPGRTQALATPPCSRSRSPHGARPWPVGFCHHGTSRRQSPTSAHGRCRAGNGEERGRTLRARNPATLPLQSPQQAAWRSPRFSQKPMVLSPPRKSHSESFVWQTRGPALGTAPMRRRWGFRHHGTSRRQSPTRTHALCRAGNGEEWGRTQRTRNPATLPI